MSWSWEIGAGGLKTGTLPYWGLDQGKGWGKEGWEEQPLRRKGDVSSKEALSSVMEQVSKSRKKSLEETGSCLILNPSPLAIE